VIRDGTRFLPLDSQGVKIGQAAWIDSVRQSLTYELRRLIRSACE
jgi:hypothetical protein